MQPFDVICIVKSKWRDKDGKGKEAEGPVFEELCTVLDTNEKGYYLLSGYNKGHFAPEHFVKLPPNRNKYIVREVHVDASLAEDLQRYQTKEALN